MLFVHRLEMDQFTCVLLTLHLLFLAAVTQVLIPGGCRVMLLPLAIELTNDLKTWCNLPTWETK